MKMKSLFVLTCASLALAVLLTAGSTFAATITHADITPGAPGYASVDGQFTLTPVIAGGGPGGVFGPTAGCCIGVDGGSNNSGTDDGDGDPLTTGDREQLDISLDADASLSSVNLIFTRADGPETNDGVVFTGFTGNPGATLDAAAIGDGVTAIYDNGSVFVSHPWRGGNLTTVSFNYLNKSRGQTISILANDSDQTGPQAVVHGLTSVAVPEPVSSVLLLVAAGALIFRRR